MNEREELRELLKKHSILKGDFTLSSGRKSDYYINGKMTTLHSRGLYLAAKLILDALENEEFEAFAGPTIGADPLIGALLTLSSQRGMSKNGLLIRKESKGHGTRNLVEGRLEQGTRVVLLEDVSTTGGSLLKAAGSITAGGGKIVCISTLVDREEGASQRIAQAGFLFKPLFSVSELL